MYKIEQTFNHFNFSFEYILNIPKDQQCVVTYHLDFDNSMKARAFLNHVYTLANKESGCIFEPPLIEVLEEKNGSIILTVVASAILTLLISYAVKIVAHNLTSIHIECVLRKEIVKEIKNTNGSLSKLQKVCTLAKDTNLLSQTGDEKMVQKLSSELSKGEIIEMILRFLI